MTGGFDDRFQPVTVAARHAWAPHLVTLTLDAPTPGAPGQFVQLGLVVEGEPVHRAYSLASTPDEPLMTYLVDVKGGTLSPSLCAVQPGDTVWMGKTLGRFTLDHVGAGQTLWMLATGAGLGPFRAMLAQGTVFERFDRVVLVHAVREAAHRSYLSELTALAQKHPLSVHHAVTRDAVPDTLAGHLQEHLADGSLEALVGHTIDDTSQVMLVGNPGMVRGCLPLLKARGATIHTPRRPGQLHLERYW